MENTYTINDLIEITGLKEKFIRNCIESLKDNVLKDSIKRGNKNSLIFDSNTLQIFDFIKQKNESGFSISTIKEELLKENIGKTNSETEVNKGKADPIIVLIDELKNMNSSLLKIKDDVISKEREINLKEKEILEKDNVISTLKSNLRLLTEGKQPDEFVQEQIKQKETLMKIEFENNNNKTLIKSQSEKILSDESRITELEGLLQKKKVEITDLENKSKQTENRRNDIISQLQLIEGKFFMTKKRKELIKQLQELY